MKRVLVTGGARGIGRRLALHFAGQGHQVLVADLDPSPLEGAPALRAFPLDVGDCHQVEELAARLSAEGRVDILVNNACRRGPAAEAVDFPIEEWEEVLRVNLTGPFLLARALAPGMKAAGWGRIINVASVAGKGAYPLRSAYAVSKWGLVGLSVTLAQELGASGVTVNAVCPGPVENEAMREVIRGRARTTGQTEEAVRAELLARQAIPRFPGEEQVVSLIAYLASEEAWAVTGQAIDVACGYRG